LLKNLLINLYDLILAWRVITFNSISVEHGDEGDVVWVVVVGILTRTLMGESYVPEMIVWLVERRSVLTPT
jgi:hypothetical protein